MTIDQILTMILRRLMGRAINRGIDTVTRGATGPGGAADQAMARQAQHAMRKARQAARMARRIGKL